jgi:hypothetical protein
LTIKSTLRFELSPESLRSADRRQLLLTREANRPQPILQLPFALTTVYSLHGGVLQLVVARQLAIRLSKNLDGIHETTATIRPFPSGFSKPQERASPDVPGAATSEFWLCFVSPPELYVATG